MTSQDYNPFDLLPSPPAIPATAAGPLFSEAALASKLLPIRAAQTTLLTQASTLRRQLAHLLEVDAELSLGLESICSEIVVEKMLVQFPEAAALKRLSVLVEAATSRVSGDSKFRAVLLKASYNLASLLELTNLNLLLESQGTQAVLRYGTEKLFLAKLYQGMGYEKLPYPYPPRPAPQIRQLYVRDEIVELFKDLADRKQIGKILTKLRRLDPAALRATIYSRLEPFVGLGEHPWDAWIKTLLRKCC